MTRIWSLQQHFAENLKRSFHRCGNENLANLLMVSILNHWVKWIDCHFRKGTLMKNAFSFCIESEQYSDMNHLTRPRDWAYHIFSIESIAPLLYLYLLCFIISGWVHFQLSKYIINHFYGVAPSKRTLIHCVQYIFVDMWYFCSVLLHNYLVKSERNSQTYISIINTRFFFFDN